MCCPGSNIAGRGYENLERSGGDWSIHLYILKSPREKHSAADLIRSSSSLHSMFDRRCGVRYIGYLPRLIQCSIALSWIQHISEARFCIFESNPTIFARDFSRLQYRRNSLSDFILHKLGIEYHCRFK